MVLKSAYFQLSHGAFMAFFKEIEIGRQLVNMLSWKFVHLLLCTSVQSISISSFEGKRFPKIPFRRKRTYSKLNAMRDEAQPH